jgi:RNA polymerase sigma-70 factor (ECF subfamily)
MVNDSDIASDVVQEVFIYLHQKLLDGIEIFHMRSWLYKATFNKCVDHLRKQKKFVGIDLAGDMANEEVATDEADTKTKIVQALEKLSEKEKILVVAYSEGLTYKEMAELTGIKFNSIGKTLARTLKKMECELKKEKYGLFG